MADDELMEDESGEVTETQRDIYALMEADSLIDLLDDNELTRIGSKCLDGFEADLASRSAGDEGDTWEDRYQRYLDIAMQVRKAKTFPWPKASNIKIPLLTSAAIGFQARAYPAIVDGSNLVKGRVLGADPDGMKRQRADRIGEHMTWQLLYNMPGWEEDTDRLLLQLPIVGCVFRKTYYDVVQKRNVSKTVTALDFVINYWATSIEDAPRYTHVLRFYPHEVEERFRSGIWCKVPMPVTQDEKDDSETAPVEFLEQFCRLDLDDDGYPEPYVVTLCRETGDVVRMECCYDVDTVTVNERTHEIVRIDPKRYFTKYGFIPSPDGSFYDMGFGALLDDITAAIDTTVNQLLDAGALQNAQGGFVGSGVNMKAGALRFNLGEWKRMDVTGGTLRENIVPLNLPGPSAVLLNLLELLISQAEKITSSSDALTGTSTSTEQPTTLLARIEQATKVMTGIFKRVHRNFGQELIILFGLNRDHLDEKAYYALTDAPGQIGRADYQDKDIDVVPVSDPTMINDAQRAVKAQALLQFNGDPLTNQVEIRRRYFEGTGQNNIDELMKVPPPQPDPALAKDAAELANKRDDTLAKIRASNATAAAQLMSAAASAFTMDLTNDVATLAGAATRLGTDAADMEDNGEPVDGPGGAGGMEGAPADAGVPQVPEGPPASPDGVMGSGPTDGAGMAAGGEPAGFDPASAI